MRTKLGTEMKIMMSVEMIVSVGLFFLRAAHTPMAMPSGVERMIEMTFNSMVIGRRSMMISMAPRLTEIEVETPQFHWVKILPSQ